LFFAWQTVTRRFHSNASWQVQRSFIHAGGHCRTGLASGAWKTWNRKLKKREGKKQQINKAVHHQHGLKGDGNALAA